MRFRTERRRDTRRLSGRHADRHDAIGRVGAMRSGNASAAGEKIVQLPRKQRPIRDIKRYRGVGMSFRLAAAGRVVNIDQEPCVMNDYIILFCAIFHIAVLDHTVTHDAARFAHTERAAARLESAR